MVDETKTVEKSERKSFSRLESYTVKKEENKDDKTFKLPPPKPLGNKASDYETIKGLWVGLKNWHLLCRLVKIDFQEFKKKK